MKTLTQADIDFLNDQNSPNRGIPVTETLKAKYIRQFDRPILKEMEGIYKRTVNPDFVLCYHCRSEVYSMVETLYKNLGESKEAVPSSKEVISQPQVLTDEAQEEPKDTEAPKTPAKKTARKK